MAIAEAFPIEAVPEDEAGFAALVVRHQRLVYGLARRALGNPGDAEDVAQEVFLALYRHRAEIVSSEHLAFWLRRVAARKCIDFRRRRRWSGELPELAAPDSPGDPWQAERLRRLVGELPMRARLVVILRYQQDLDPAEIAPVLGMRLTTVKSHLRRSLARLRQRWAAGGYHA